MVHDTMPAWQFPGAPIIDFEDRWWLLSSKGCWVDRSEWKNSNCTLFKYVWIHLGCIISYSYFICTFHSVLYSYVFEYIQKIFFRIVFMASTIFLSKLISAVWCGNRLKISGFGQLLAFNATERHTDLFLNQQEPVLRNLSFLMPSQCQRKS
jgi:hypothetical protein